MSTLSITNVNPTCIRNIDRKITLLNEERSFSTYLIASLQATEIGGSHDQQAYCLSAGRSNTLF